MIQNGAQHFEEGFAVEFELTRADAGHLGQLLDIIGSKFADGDQGFVMQYHVGRHALFLRQLGAMQSQRFKQFGIASSQVCFAFTDRWFGCFC